MVRFRRGSRCYVNSTHRPGNNVGPIFRSRAAPSPPQTSSSHPESQAGKVNKR